MTLWIDVSDIYLSKNFQLTGINRTIVFVIDALSKQRTDLRFFRYCPEHRWFSEAFPHQFPPAVREHIPSALKAFEGQQAPDYDTDGAAQAPRWFNVPVFRLRSGVTQRTKQTATQRHAPFAHGDVCLSISATWSMPGYQEAMAACKLKTGIKCINLVYDLIPALFPHWVAEQYANRFTHWVRGNIKNADMLLAISEFQKKEIDDYISKNRLPAKPIAVIRLGDHDPVRVQNSTDEATSLPRYIPPGSFVLCVSHLDVRKNLFCLYHVWRRLALKLGTDCPQLMLVGGRGSLTNDLLYQIAHDPIVQGVVVLLAKIPDHELNWYYENCLFTVYPSFYEGWGLPIAESLCRGKLCIASNTSSMPEVGGDLVDYFDPADIEAFFKLTLNAITDPDYVKGREDEIKRRYTPTPWASTAQQISALVDRLSSTTLDNDTYRGEYETLAQEP